MESGISFDLGQFSLNLEKLQNFHAAGMRKALENIGDLVSGAAKDRAPLKEGVLTMSIEPSVQGDTAVVIRVPSNAPASSYAVPMHENEYKLGEKSSMKSAKHGVEVGRKYITRAIEDSAEEIRAIALRELST